MKYRFRATPSFRKSLAHLTPSQKASARKAFAIFKIDPFDPMLRTHKIHRVSAKLGRSVYSVWIEADVRALFYLDGDFVVSIEIGSHKIYRS